MAITPDGKLAYVVDEGSDNVTVIDTKTHSIVAIVPVEQTPSENLS
ncbi:YncE family protein [Bacillus sp. SCS-151]